MAKYNFYQNYTQRQECIAEGMVYGWVNAPSLSKAKQKIQKLITEGSYEDVPGRHFIDFDEKDLCVTDSDPCEFTGELEIEEDTDTSDEIAKLETRLRKLKGES